MGLAAATDEAKGIADSFGIDPSRLQVLEFNVVNYEAEDVLRTRFNAYVVHEHRSTGENNESLYRLIVQFPNTNQVALFRAEIASYGSGIAAIGLQPPGERNTLFDGLVEMRLPSREDRTGTRIAAEGLPGAGEFYLDIDLWHPGDDVLARNSLDTLRQICGRLGGAVLGSLRTPSLLLAKLRANPALATVVLGLPFVAHVDLPPQLIAPYSNLLMPDSFDVPDLAMPEDDDPVVAVIDSGVISGHPLLRNWVVEERDFGAGTGSEVDDHGHGTAVASLVVHGSVADALRSGTWGPRVRVCSAKVLRKHEVSGKAEFPEDQRIESVFEEAIRYFHRERGCRIFNISVEAPPDVDGFAGERQYPWAQVLDELARELDIVIVVLAGNADIPIPNVGRMRADFQKAVRDNMNCDAYRVSNPGTAALAVTVGSIARHDALGSDDPSVGDTSLANAAIGAPTGAPSPFSRVGPGYRIDETKSMIKPDMVQFGGNAALQSLAGGIPRWTDVHAYLGEPVAKFDFSGGRFVTAQAGTSFACPQVANAAAVASVALETSLGRVPSANLIRAILGSATRTPDCGEAWLTDEETRLRLTGYGFCDTDAVSWSRPNSVRLVAEAEIEDDKLLVFRLSVPNEFLSTKGRRGITVALAFDPPVRATRREYLTRTLWFEVLQGLSRDEIAAYKAKNVGEALRTPSGLESTLDRQGRAFNGPRSRCAGRSGRRLPAFGARPARRNRHCICSWEASGDSTFRRQTANSSPWWCTIGTMETPSSSTNNFAAASGSRPLE